MILRNAMQELACLGGPCMCCLYLVLSPYLDCVVGGAVCHAVRPLVLRWHVTVSFGSANRNSARPDHAQFDIAASAAAESTAVLVISNNR